MKTWSRIHSALRNLLHKEQAERQLDSELRAYVEMVTDEKTAEGMSASEARRSTLAEFGGMEQVKQAVRDRRAGRRQRSVAGKARRDVPGGAGPVRVR